MIYYKLNGTNLIRLNKSYCSNVKVEISIHIALTENIDKLNTSSDYYKDICYTATSDSGTDILLKDRKNEFINSNKAVCQDGCDFIKYDYNTQKAICSCDIKESPDSFASMNIDKEKLFKNFINIKNIANIQLLKCYKVLFNKNNLRRNLGFLIIIPIIIFHFICIILLHNKSLNAIKNIIKNIIFGIKNWKLVKKDKKAKSMKIKIKNKEGIINAQILKGKDINKIVLNKNINKSEKKHKNPKLYLIRI